MMTTNKYLEQISTIATHVPSTSPMSVLDEHIKLYSYRPVYLIKRLHNQSKTCKFKDCNMGACTA